MEFKDFLFEYSNLFVFLSFLSLVFLAASIIFISIGNRKFTKSILIEDTYFNNLKLEHSINYIGKELSNDYMRPIVDGRC